RRAGAQTATGQNADLNIGGLAVSISNYVVKMNGKKVDMPPKEIELIYYLGTNPMRVFTREQLLMQVWGTEYRGDTRTVDVHVKRIREKLGTDPNWRLDTVWGVGYKFEIIN
ncbi:MAG: response regulator transcription factor, partial [Firmicutes bacterium]|nr:response regulator transcription factor [Bacillota bacterium]